MLQFAAVDCRQIDIHDQDLLSLRSCYYASLCLPGFYFCSREQFIYIAITAVICQLVAFIAETTVHKYVVIAYIYYIM